MKLQKSSVACLLAAVVGLLIFAAPLAARAAGNAPEAVTVEKEDGEYSISVDLYGGSGKSTVTSPALMRVEDGKAYVRLEWSSPNYDYMLVEDTRYLPVNEGGNSVFEIPITAMDQEMTVIADTTAMGTPHEIAYSLLFYSDSIGSKGQMPGEAAKRVLAIAFLIIVLGGILSHFSKKKREE